MFEYAYAVGAELFLAPPSTGYLCTRGPRFKLDLVLHLAFCGSGGKGKMSMVQKNSIIFCSEELRFWLYIYIYIYNHQQVMLLAQISLTFSLSLHLSLLYIAASRSSRLHPVSTQTCCRWVLVGQPTLARLCKGFHWITSFMISTLLLEKGPACLVRLICIVLEMGDKWPYSCCFVRCCFQDLLNIARSILVQFLSSFVSIRFVGVYVVQPYSSINKTAAWKKFHFYLSDRLDFHMTDSLSIAFHAFAMCILISFSVDETLLPRYVTIYIYIYRIGQKTL